MLPNKPLSFIPKVSFQVRKKRSRSPQDIFLIFRINKEERLQMSTQLKVRPKHWDFKRQRFKSVEEFIEFDEYNRYLDELSESVKTIYRKANGEITAAELKRRLTQSNSKKEKEKITLFGFIEDYLEKRAQRVEAKRGTEKVLNTVFNHLKAYAEYMEEEPDFDDIDKRFAESFKQWLYRENQHSVNYVKKIFSVLRQFMRAAFEEELTDNTIFNRRFFTERKLPVVKVALSPDELDQLREIHLEGLEATVRDYFLVGCYTGMRYSDFSRLTKDHVIKKDDETFIRIYTRKTNTYCMIPCFPELLEIMERHDFQLPKAPRNQVMNRTLKKVCRKAKVNEMRLVINTRGGVVRKETHPKYLLVSSHSARRTFATIMYYYVGLPAAQIMSITGHSTERQFTQYLDWDLGLRAYSDITGKYKEWQKRRKKDRDS